MTSGEFRAWLDGFEEALAGKAPNQKQWKKIKEKLETVSDGCNCWHWHYWQAPTISIPSVFSTPAQSVPNEFEITWYNEGTSDCLALS